MPKRAFVESSPEEYTPSGLWLVPHALELCHPGLDVAGAAWGRGLGRDEATLAPQGPLGVKTPQTGGQRRGSAPPRKRLRTLVANV